jgi:hypothetical protein
VTGAEHDLGYVMAPGEPRQSLGCVVTFQFVPTTSDLGHDTTEIGEFIVASSTGSRADDVDSVEVGFDPGGHPRSRADDGICARRGGNSDHDAISGLPLPLGLLPFEVLEELHLG